MAGKINFLGHPVHPMVIVYPLTFFTLTVVLDVIYLLHPSALVGTLSYWSIGAGVISGLVAAVFGTADWIGLQSGTRAKRIGLWHGGVNVVTTLLFALSWLLRHGSPASPALVAMMVSFAAFAFSLIAAWLGGELVYRLSVGVDEGAHVDSPSSFSDRPASADKRS
ncbi:MAG: rane protein [Verrucomicrobiales bacterium]|nr:rane protein [Verrucomicrobiales bacterium]